MIWKTHKRPPPFCGVIVERKREHRGTHWIAPLGVNLAARAAIRTYEIAKELYDWAKLGRSMRWRTIVPLLLAAACCAAIWVKQWL